MRILIKKPPLWHKAFLLLLFPAVICLAYFITTAQHELVHQEIFTQYGINSSIHYNFFSLDNTMAYTKVEDIEAYIANCDSFCELAHNLNDAIGYHFLALVTIMILLFICWMVYK